MAAAPDNRNKKVTYKNWAPFINCISEINNTQVDDVVMPMYNVTKHSNIFWKTSRGL